MLEQIDYTIDTVKTLEKCGEKVMTSNDMYKLGVITL